MRNWITGLSAVEIEQLETLLVSEAPKLNAIIDTFMRAVASGDADARQRALDAAAKSPLYSEAMAHLFACTERAVLATRDGDLRVVEAVREEMRAFPDHFSGAQADECDPNKLRAAFDFGFEFNRRQSSPKS